jgi:hypothetical protein
MVTTTSFFEFMLERQNIFHRRFELREPPPWTDDEILGKYLFCNVMRELDRQTLFNINHITRRPDSTKDPLSLIFSTVAYRLFNKPETYLFMSSLQNGIDVIHGDFWYEDIPLLNPAKWNPEATKDYLDEIKFDGSGESFSLVRKAYTISSHHHGVPTHYDIIDSILTPLANMLTKITGNDGVIEDRNGLIISILRPSNVQETFDALTSIYGLGEFLAYEVLCDLNYSDLWTFDAEQTFVNIGPGAKRGLQRLNIAPTIENLTKLQHKANTYLAKHNFPFFRGRKLSLRCIEHAACEYDKYRRKVEFDSGKSNHRAVLRKFNGSDDKVYLDMLNSRAMKGLYSKWQKQSPEGFIHE